MKKIVGIFTAFCILYCSNSIAKTIVISDLDDTVRQANVLDWKDAVKRLRKGVKPFKPLVALLNSVQEVDTEYYYISASYRLIYNGPKWIEEQGLPKGPVFQRKIFKGKRDYKFNTIKNILDSSLKDRTTDRVLLLGDNAELDPEVYQDIVMHFDLERFRILIRDVKGIEVLERGLFYSPKIDYFISGLELGFDKEFSNFRPLARKLSQVPNHKIVPTYMLNNYSKIRADSKCLYNDQDELDPKCEFKVKSWVQSKLIKYIGFLRAKL